MTPISYMTPNGDFAASCQTADDKPHPGLIEAPDGGAYGMRWDGNLWGEDAEAQARADAFMYGAPVPESVSRIQARKALGRDMWTAADAAITASGNWDLQCEFEEPTWYRNNPHIIAMAVWLFHMSPAQLDDLFRLAATK
jgi:hypothetical protein